MMQDHRCDDNEMVRLAFLLILPQQVGPYYPGWTQTICPAMPNTNSRQPRNACINGKDIGKMIRISSADACSIVSTPIHMYFAWHVALLCLEQQAADGSC